MRSNRNRAYSTHASAISNPGRRSLTSAGSIASHRSTTYHRSASSSSFRCLSTIVGSTLDITGRKSMLDRLRDQSLRLEPGAGPQVERGDLFRALRDVSAAPRGTIGEQVVKPEPLAPVVQRDDEETARFLQRVDETDPVGSSGVAGVDRRSSRLPRRTRAEAIEDGGREQPVSQGGAAARSAMTSCTRYSPDVLSASRSSLRNRVGILEVAQAQSHQAKPHGPALDLSLHVGERRRRLTACSRSRKARDSDSVKLRSLIRTPSAGSRPHRRQRQSGSRRVTITNRSGRGGRSRSRAQEPVDLDGRDAMVVVQGQDEGPVDSVELVDQASGQDRDRRQTDAPKGDRLLKRRGGRLDRGEEGAQETPRSPSVGPSESQAQGRLSDSTQRLTIVLLP